MNAEFYLQHGVPGGPYLTERVPADAVRETERVPQRGQTQSGYGGAIPTRYQLRWRGRWRRVYCMRWSNAGTLYIRAKDGHSGIIVVTAH